MSEALALRNTLPPATPEALAKIAIVEEKVLALEQVDIQTEHVLHAGMYARTIRIPAGVVIVGALYKVPTIVIVRGNCAMLAGDKWYPVADYQVMPAVAGRKQIFYAFEPTEITMVCRSKAKTVAEAEDAFTDEADKLLSRKQGDKDLVIITGVEACPEP